jgi:hypothetical protein
MPEATCQREACSCCGSSTWAEAHFAAGALVCRGCWCEIEASGRKGPPAQRSGATEGDTCKEPDRRKA